MFARMSRYGPVADGTTRQRTMRATAQPGRYQHYPAPGGIFEHSEQRTLNLRAYRAQADPAACLSRRYEQDQPAAQLGRTAENRPPGMHGMHQSDGAVRAPCNGTKRARIGKASGYTNRSFCPDAVRLPASPQ